MLLRLFGVMHLTPSFHFLFKGDNPSYVISSKTTTTTKLACLQTFDFFHTWYDDRDHKVLHFDISLAHPVKVYGHRADQSQR